MNKVLIPTKLSDVAANTLKTAGYEVIQDADTPLEKQVAAHPDAVALIVRSEKVTPEIMDALPSLKLVVRAGAGYDNIDIVYARKKNVDVMNTPGANSNAVAEEVMAMILAYYRHIVQADATTREGLWEKKKYMGSELTKKTVGIIGLGNIGRNLVKRLQGFEPILLGYDHFLARQRALNIGVTPTSIEDIFSQCDIITLHVPGGPSTHHMVNAELIGKMKDGAVLINCSRYGVVDEEALAAAKAAGKNIGYLTDVHPKDAPGEKPSAPIADLILPHLGANTREANTKAAKRAAEQMIAYFSDGDTSCVVNGESPSGLNPAHLQRFCSPPWHARPAATSPSAAWNALFTATCAFSANGLRPPFWKAFCRMRKKGSCLPPQKNPCGSTASFSKRGNPKMTNLMKIPSRWT